MEIRGQLQVSGVLPPGKELPVPTAWEDKGIPERFGEKNIFLLRGKGTEILRVAVTVGLHYLGSVMATKTDGRVTRNGNVHSADSVVRKPDHGVRGAVTGWTATGQDYDSHQSSRYWLVSPCHILLFLPYSYYPLCFVASLRRIAQTV